MKTRIISIGNSRGILLGKTVLEAYGLRDSVDLVLKEDHIELRPVSSPRRGWEKAFERMHSRGDDELLLDDSLDGDLLDEWEWK